VFAILFSILTTNTIIYMHYKHKYVWTLNSDILNFIEHRDVTHNFESVPTKDHFSSIKFLSRRFQCDHYQNMHNLNKLTERKKIITIQCSHIFMFIVHVNYCICSQNRKQNSKHIMIFYSERFENRKA
jgi:hypothetical protein